MDNEALVIARGVLTNEPLARIRPCQLVAAGEKCHLLRYVFEEMRN